MSDLLCDDDFELDAAGYLRNASPIESVRQEIGRLAEESGRVAKRMTPALAAEVVAGVLGHLGALFDSEAVKVDASVRDTRSIVVGVRRSRASSRAAKAVHGANTGSDLASDFSSCSLQRFTTFGASFRSRARASATSTCCRAAW